MRALLRQLGRIRTRLFVVNVLVLLVPVAGVEFARIYERQLLAGLERDMRDQAAIVRETVEEGASEGRPLDDPRSLRILRGSAHTTRTRIRILNERGAVMLDSHADGAPEGPEAPAPTILPSSVYSQQGVSSPDVAEMWSTRSLPRGRWPSVERRREVRRALRGRPDAYTRIRERAPAVFLFVTEPIRHQGNVIGVVYVTRSTQPVLTELYRIRSGLIRVLIVAVLFTLVLTLLLSWSIARPLGRLAKAARRIARGERAVVPVAGSGEIRELGEAFATMTDKLDGRMRYIRDFAADVAHELKSPLTSIRGAAELLREGAAEDPEARGRFLGNIELDAERLDRLVNRLLELSRIESSQAPMDEFDFGALVERVIERTHTAEQPVRVEWRASARQFRGREADIERALLNLVENALRFSSEGAPVDIVVSASQKPPALLVSVRDRGPGVPAALRRKVFERFFTTDADRNGTGLGLAIVESVASAHGGSVELQSSEGKGATFTMALPHPAA